ncbi:lactonase family protein [Pelagicoccus sp. SDUM812002]|uniref:lactonase family protein n=1 Tax=Pelagicoccus sp. SDUM812002 TaxID=3041266 RepID=UPI002810A9CF|nr:lactonase family protein [Pelagicoccus sp. SDUM812002]
MLLAIVGFGVAQAEPIWIAGAGGVYRSELEDESGQLSEPDLACAFGSGSFLAIHPELDILYSSYRNDQGLGYASLQAGGAEGEWEVQSFQLVESGNAHLAVSANGRFLAGAHWGGRSNYVFELESDGRISGRLIQLEQWGSGPAHSQEQSRPHWVAFADEDKLLHSVDLGSDEIWTYAVGDSVEAISLEHRVKFPRGTGPRHMALDSGSGLAYVSGELNLAVNTFHYDARSGRFSPLQYIATVEDEAASGRNSLSEIQVHESGRFVYTAVRGLDLMVAFSADPETGMLTKVEQQGAGVKWPRNFTISDSGKWLIVAGQHSDELRVFSIDQNTGELEPTDSRIEVKAPMCVRAWGRL